MNRFETSVPRVLLPALICLALLGAMLTSAGPAGAAGCPCTIWPATAVPGTPADSDASAVEVGVKFRTDVAGHVTGVRFYKGSGNSGTHIGHLWSATGVNLGTVTFNGETATGWQTATFAGPIAISADTTYVVSYYAPNGRYAVDGGAFAASGVDNGPLHALRDGVDGASGVYRYGIGGGFPTNSWQSANYWVDVVFDTTLSDTTPPAVAGTSPDGGATAVPTTSAVSATFSEPVQSGTATIAVTAGGSPATGVTGYDAATRTVIFTPASGLAVSTTYTVTVSGALDNAGNAMAAYSWSFSTAGAGGSGCPCTIWPGTATPATASTADNSAVEVGVRFRTSTPGFVTGLRFYKGASNTGTHTGGLWTNSGTRLATVTFTGESGSGWQTATLAAPVAVLAGVTYVASYHTDTGFYSTTGNGLAAAVSRGPLTALANGTDGANGIYRYGASAFPSSTFQATNYWVDVVFHTTATDNVAPVAATRVPAPGAAGVSTSGAFSATFSEPVTASSIVMALSGPAGSVAGTTAYDATTSTVTFTPAAALANSAGYTLALNGARDLAGNVMAPVTWSFTTAAPAPPPPDQGPGGPVLVVKSAASGASGFTSFLAEVMRTEGLNEFATADLAAVTAAVLAQYDVVLLGPTPLSPAQVTMLTTWVTGGGNLIAFRPDKQLAGLLGLTATTGTLAEGYLKVDTTTSPGAGITDQTIQYHGTADRYALAGARAVATLYANASTATTNPAVSLVGVGGAGGQAAAFSFDLAQSLVYTRQGNPAWEKQERDGSGPIRSDDLFFGGAAADWVDLTKVAIPQADEQQRLLANLIGAMNLDRKPMPRFWYFPRSLKAVVVATGDDHATGGTAGRFDQYAANSPAGCVVEDWQCARFTSYVFPNAPLSNAQASSYQSRGFEVGLHGNTNCADFTPASLAAAYTGQLSTWRTKYSSGAPPATNRMHCLVWSDWSTQASTEGANAIRLDTNYYYWPGSWIANRPGFMTGSGMPMRFTGRTGGLIDVYQAATQMTDESDQSYPFTVDALLDAATGAPGRYGAFTVNMHTDQATTFDSDQVLASAQRHGVPLITARQLLTWLDGRNASSYASISFSANTLSFSVNVGAGANGLTGMLPVLGTGGRTLTTLIRAGTAVPFTRTTIKGVEYAMFAAAPGTYAAGYAGPPARTFATPAPDGTAVAPPGRLIPPAADRRAPATSAVSVLPRPDGTAAVSWRTDEPAAAALLIGRSPDALAERTGDRDGTRHTVVATRLQPSATYHYRVRSVDPAGNVTVWPALSRPTATFVSAAAGVADYTGPQLHTGTARRTTVSADGVRLVPGARTGGLVSRVLDAGQMVTWDRLSYQSTVPAGATLRLFVRTGSTSTPDTSWTGWTGVAQGGRVVAGSRYAQYRVELIRSRAGDSPVFGGASITSNAAPPIHPTER